MKFKIESVFEKPDFESVEFNTVKEVNDFCKSKWPDVNYDDFTNELHDGNIDKWFGNEPADEDGNSYIWVNSPSNFGEGEMDHIATITIIHEISHGDSDLKYKLFAYRSDKLEKEPSAAFSGFEDLGRFCKLMWRGCKFIGRGGEEKAILNLDTILMGERESEQPDHLFVKTVDGTKVAKIVYS